MSGSTSDSSPFRYVALVVLCALAVASFAAAADRALIVGVGDYATVSDLPGIQLDVDMMKEVAEDLGFQNVETLTDQEATYDGFKAAFERLIADTGAGDRVLFYFSGHGACVADQDGDETDGKDETLVLYDTRGGTMERSLRDDEFYGLLQRLADRQVLVLIDACHSGTSYKGFNLTENQSLGAKATRLGSEQWEAYRKSLDCEARSWTSGKTFEVVDDMQAARVAFLAAAADHELALATSAGSLFTLGLHKTVNDAAGAQGSLTLQTLRDRVNDFIKSKIASGDVRGEPHEPQLWGDPAFSIRPAVPPAGRGPVWRRLEQLADRNDITRLSITVNKDKDSYRVGDELVLTIDLPHAGYLNVVNVGSQDNATVLFPNRHHRDNYVQDDVLTIPTPAMDFRIRAGKPTGPSLNVVFLTEQEINLYEDSVGGRDKSGNFEVLLATLSAKGKNMIMRTFEVTASNSEAAGGKVIVDVK